MNITREAPFPGASFGATLRLDGDAGKIVAAAEAEPEALPAALAEAKGLLLIQGMEDAFSSPVQLSAIADVVSGPVKWVMLHGEGHFPQHDNPEQIFQLVEAHIDTVRSAASRRVIRHAIAAA